MADAPLRVALLSILLRGVTIFKTGKTAVLPKFPEIFNPILIKGGDYARPTDFVSPKIFHGYAPTASYQELV